MASTWRAPARFVRSCSLVTALVWVGHGAALAGPPDLAAALRAQHAALTEQLSHNPFDRPIVLQSTQTSGDLRGDIYAVVEHPFATVDEALQGANHWCDILMLHLNVKGCSASEVVPRSSLAVSIGRKVDQPLASAFRVDFSYRIAEHASDYLQVLLNADSGPLGTHDYRIALEAVQLDSQRSFIHMSYSYTYGLAARLAMQGYLSTLGSDKVGFSVVDRRGDGRPVYVGSVRGVVERNTMRYYLAIDAYLNALSSPPQERLERRLHEWFAATERYRLQLHELEQSEYLAMKRKEVRRQRSSEAAPG
ncbi:hypothetical protein [Piscinibacter sp.]|jgi:hypothetical protein|uniref:hypothetical protein n=1 Tax=Piscinibacter sp. TaxID=1903157 RepID=UPI00355A5315